MVSFFDYVSSEPKLLRVRIKADGQRLGFHFFHFRYMHGVSDGSGTSLKTSLGSGAAIFL